jgi:hypothetical protein
MDLPEMVLFRPCDPGRRLGPETGSNPIRRLKRSHFDGHRTVTRPIHATPSRRPSRLAEPILRARIALVGSRLCQDASAAWTRPRSCSPNPAGPRFHNAMPPVVSPSPRPHNAMPPATSWNAPCAAPSSGPRHAD